MCIYTPLVTCSWHLLPLQMIGRPISGYSEDIEEVPARNTGIERKGYLNTSGRGRKLRRTDKSKAQSSMMVVSARRTT